MLGQSWNGADREDNRPDDYETLFKASQKVHALIEYLSTVDELGTELILAKQIRNQLNERICNMRYYDRKG